MAYKLENILKNIASCLEAISTAAGYENNVTGVTLWATMPQEEDIDHSNFPTFVVVCGSDENTDGKEIMLRRFRPRVRAFIDDKTAPASSLVSLCGDAIKAMLSDRERGGHAHNTVYQGMTVLDSENKPYAAADLAFEVWFENLYTSP